MDIIRAQRLDLWGSIIHSFSIFLAPSTGPNVAATACSQEVQSLVSEKDHQSKDGVAVFYLQAWNSKILWKPLIIFERLRFTCEATKPDWCLPGFLVLICPICDTGTFHRAFVCLGTVCWPNPTGDKGQAPYHLPGIRRPCFVKHTQLQGSGSGVADECYRAGKTSPEGWPKLARASHSDTSQKRWHLNL